MTNPRPLSQLGLLACVLLVAGGCAAPPREVKVEALARPSSTGRDLQSYTIRPNPRLASDALRYREATQQLKTALSAQGLWESPEPEKADLIVEIDYGIEPPTVRHEKVRVPIYSRRGGAEESAAEPPMGRVVNRSPNPKLVDYEETTVAVTVYEKHFTVSGRENVPTVEGRAPPEVFRVSARIEDPGTDLRGSLPLLTSAVMGRIGRTTDGADTTKVGENDEAVIFIRRGM